jgi:hypothetical protein
MTDPIAAARSSLLPRLKYLLRGQPSDVTGALLVELAADWLESHKPSSRLGLLQLLTAQVQQLLALKTRQNGPTSG